MNNKRTNCDLSFSPCLSYLSCSFYPCLSYLSYLSFLSCPCLSYPSSLLSFSSSRSSLIFLSPPSPSVSTMKSILHPYLFTYSLLSLNSFCCLLVPHFFQHGPYTLNQAPLDMTAILNKVNKFCFFPRYIRHSKQLIKCGLQGGVLIISNSFIQQSHPFQLRIFLLLLIMCSVKPYFACIIQFPLILLFFSNTCIMITC